MFVIIKNDETVLNLLFEQDTLKVEKYISDYLQAQVTYLETDVQSTYTIESKGNHWFITKNYKKVNKGYIYNSHTTAHEQVMNVKYYSFDGAAITETDSNSSTLKVDINNEINNRVLRQLDKDALYQVFGKVGKCILAKSSVTSQEFTMIVTDVVQHFKKDLYSSIAKKMRRFGKRKSSQRKND
jgi:hypothetical protein